MDQHRRCDLALATFCLLVSFFSCKFLAHPAAASSTAGHTFRYKFCCCFLFIFNDPHADDYLKIYRTDLRHMVRIGRTMAVADRSETLSTELCISVVSSTKLIRWTQAASGAARRANVELCCTNSYIVHRQL